MQNISLKIDGKQIEALPGQTILEVAREHGIPIPTLCQMEGLSGVGACRLCLVEISGTNRLLPACTTPVQEQLSIVTQSEKLARYRRMIIELLLSERNHICSVCVSNGHCELQAMALELGVSHTRFPYLYPRLTVDASHERFVLDQNRCILCTRCVRVCAEVEGAHVWNVMSRGVHSRLVADMKQPWGESETCTSCGKCVQICPTGALAAKGCAVEEMCKEPLNLAQLTSMRGGNHS